MRFAEASCGYFEALLVEQKRSPQRFSSGLRLEQLVFPPFKQALLGNPQASFSCCLMVWEKCPVKCVSFLFLLLECYSHQPLLDSALFASLKTLENSSGFSKQVSQPLWKTSERGPGFSQAAQSNVSLSQTFYLFLKSGTENVYSRPHS